MTALDFGASMLFVTIGYLLGSILFGQILTRFFKRANIREHGSGNAGATNVARSFGTKLGIAVLLSDLLKPVIAMLIAFLLKSYTGASFLQGGITQLAGVGAIIGHAYPLYFKFKGGKASATLVGFHLAIAWPLLLVYVAFFGLLMTWKRRVSLGSVLAPFLVLPVQITLGVTHITDLTWISPLVDTSYPWWVSSICLFLMALLVLFKHRSNLKRLITGQEAAFKVAKVTPKEK